MALSGHNLSKNWADPQPSDACRRALGLFQPKNADFAPAVCGDQGSRAQKGFNRVDVKVWLEIDPPDRDFSD
jgi:hypothetical protein